MKDNKEETKMFEIIMFIMLFALCLLACGIMSCLVLLSVKEEERLKRKIAKELETNNKQLS